MAIPDERPALAASRTLEISIQDARNQTFDDIIVSWLNREPTGSREWLGKESANLPDEWKLGWLKGVSSKAKTETDLD